MATTTPPARVRKDHAKRQTKQSKSKFVTLYIRLSEEISEPEHLKEYLINRMGSGSKVTFDVLNVTSQTTKPNNTRADLKFASKSMSSKAANILHKSNKLNKTKIQCYSTKEEADMSAVRDQRSEEILFAQALREIVETANVLLQQHGDKIQDVLDRLHKTSLSKSDANISLNDFEKITLEEEALKYKKDELEKQRAEFQSHLVELKGKLQLLRGSRKVDLKLQTLRKEFGIECNRLRSAFPMYARRSDIVSVVKKNQVSVILGETGSGKSTQMAQYLLQAGLAENGLIACTQPRKIAATSLATYVASEMASSVGQVIGYQVGMKTKKTGITKVIYMTDHILLNECLQDRKLSKFSCVIIDEAHERSIYTDLLLGMVKDCLSDRPDLRVVITSATIDPSVFVRYFGGLENCPVLEISGRTFPVDVVWSNDNGEDLLDNYVDKAVESAMTIHDTTPVSSGDILVFLTSPPETEKACEKFKQHRKAKRNYQCLPLHGRLQANEQQLVFESNPAGTRKVIFATNSAETSITIPGIKFVVDTGLAKVMQYDPKKNMNSLNVTTITKSSANQRTGRAGRTGPGKCYRLYSEKTFKNMEPNTQPELLRVHLGQALLKLLDLGVDPLAFDFVESPSQASLNAAMEALCGIGAVTEGPLITGLGRWIAKLPIDPSLGVLIKKGISENVAKEALVVAAACSSSGIFYRSGTNEEKKLADMRKTRFCHEGGDLLTVLNVYREWEGIEEKKKGKWCMENSINGKSMKGVRETMNEMIIILKKELNEKITNDFQPMEESDHKIQCLLFYIMKPNICYFLGHDQAGYLNIQQNHHVQVHPSSAMKALGLQKDWVVYQQLLQTSQDFVLNVTPISDSDIGEALANEVVKINLDDIRQKRVTLAQKFGMGKRVFREMVGPMHRVRKQMEEELSVVCNGDTIILDAVREKTEFQLFCHERHAQLVKKLFDGMYWAKAEYLLEENLEEPVGEQKGGVRALLAAGASTTQVLMPHQYTTVLIKQVVFGNKDLSSDEVDEELSTFGKIRPPIKFQRKQNSYNSIWGKVTFEQETDAKDAVESFKDHKAVMFTILPDIPKQLKLASEFKLKLSWCRRPNKGFGYISFDRPEDHAYAMRILNLLIQGHCVSIQNSRKRPNQIYLKGLGMLTSDETIKQAVARKLDIKDASAGNRIQLFIPKVDVTTQDEIPRITRFLNNAACVYAPLDAFQLTVLQPKSPKATLHRAFLTFQNPDQGQAATKGLQCLRIDGIPITVIPDLRTSVFVKKNIYEATKMDIDSCIEEIHIKIPTVRVEMKTLKSENIAINITATDAKGMGFAKTVLTEIIEGDKIECGANETIQILFTRDARSKLQEIANKCKAAIYVDDRTMTVHVQGNSGARSRSLQEINAYIDGVQGTVEKEIQLHGNGMPPGLMKCLLTKYGTNFDDLKKETGIKSVALQYRYHVLSVSGSEEAITNVETRLKELCKDLKQTSAAADEELPDCPVCFCPIEMQELHRLEYCGHSYCNSCFNDLLKFAIRDKDFPIMCAVGECNKPVVFEDLRMRIKKGCMTMKELTRASVSAFVAKNQTTFKYCITPDCNMVYRVTPNGELFTCSECQVRICTSCHIQYHDGMTCTMYKSVKDDPTQVELWLQKDPENRKRCPKCTTVIEKRGGCNHMECSACHVHLCWICLASFPTSGGCYGHLSTNHTGLFV